MPASESFQHYQVLRKPDGSLWELGRGAMGVTYKAFDTNLRCHVALKVINAQHLDSDTARQRFLREARAAAGMTHPNVATVFHLGESGGDYFYAMEFIDGETVESFVQRRGVLPAAVALKIALQVARALRAAERVGLVHRDIKPANLMLLHEEENDPGALDGDDPHLKVIDFGLAKAIEKDAASATITVAGFVGTPHFASPEQLEERDLDVRSDIYSLGVTLWYMLAGKPPFGGTVARIMSQHLGTRPPFEQLAGQPPAVVGLLARMLEKDPARRPQNATDLRREIEQTLRGIDQAGSATRGIHPGSVPTVTPMVPGTLDVLPPATWTFPERPTFSPPSAAPRGGGRFVLFALLVVVFIAAGGGLGYIGYRYFLEEPSHKKTVRRAEPVTPSPTPPPPSPTRTPKPATPSPPPAPSVPALPTAEIPVAPSVVSSPPTPAPTPDRVARYKEMLAAVEQTESEGHPAEAIDGYVRLVTDYPEQALSAMRLEALINRLRANARTGDGDTTLSSPMQRAANTGSSSAMLFLGERLIQNDPATAAAWYRKAADLGRPEAMLVLGDLYFRGTGVRQDTEQAVRWYQLASDKGSARAKLYLAECYETGQGGLRRDYDQMFRLLNEAETIEPDNPAIAEKLALAYEHGWGTSTDPKLAFEWMKKAADAGLPNAIGNLGTYYMRGVGTKTDTKAAVALFKQGADKNNAACQFFYAQCVEQGVGGVTVNRNAATELYRASANQGFAPAKQWCTQHKVSFTPAR